jgi:hypothetical protein
MNKLIVTTGIILALIVSLSSCAVTGTRTTATPRTIEANQGRIIVKPLIAEVEVDVNKKIEGSATNTKGDVESAKQLAKWEALNKSGADIIVDPVYYITTTTMTVQVKVVGFYGKYVSVETIEDTELDKLNLYIGNTGSKGEVSTNKSLKNKLNKIKN